jgi:3-oxoadipate enol-lactonase
MVEAGASETPIVIVHSLGLDWRMSHSIILALADHARVVAYDLRLHGRAIGPPTASFDLARCADDLSDLLDVLGCRTAHVVGFSLGGAVAQLFALTHPARVASLALVCTMARAPRTLYLDRARNAREHGMEAQLVETLLRWFSVEELAKNTPAVRYARAKVLGVSVDHWSQYWRALAEADTVANLRSLGRFPTSVIAAERDKSTPPASMRQIADDVPGAHFETIRAAPHMVSLECPSQTTQALVEHLHRARDAQAR